MVYIKALKPISSYCNVNNFIHAFSQAIPSKDEPNPCNHKEGAQSYQCDDESVMNVISGVKTKIHGISCHDESETVPKMGVYISPDLELKLERVCCIFILLLFLV